MRGRHEEGNVLPGAPWLLLHRTPVLSETSNNEKQRININAMWSCGKKEETGPMSLAPKAILGILAWQARDLCNYAVLVKAWRHQSLTLHDSAVRWSSEICDSSSCLASAFSIPTMRLVGKLLFLAE